ncbi:MAG: hypothetical protein GY932_03525 [Arcobacter sp.]|nr:hypothetical protein [Arcobacter sp.]
MEPFKNLFNKKLVEDFANNIFLYENTFKKEDYLNQVFKTLDDLELK